ncbi:hypothetical protein D3C71_1692350 [compost metagenome]
MGIIVGEYKVISSKSNSPDSSIVGTFGAEPANNTGKLLPTVPRFPGGLVFPMYNGTSGTPLSDHDGAVSALKKNIREFLSTLPKTVTVLSDHQLD